MNVLFSLEPFYEMYDPFKMQVWLKWLNCIDVQLEPFFENYNSKVIAFDSINYASEDLFPNKRIIFSQSELRHNWKLGGDIYVKLEMNSLNTEQYKQIKEIISNKMEDFCPDVVILLSDSKWLRQIFPSAIFINIEVSWLSRSPYPTHWQLSSIGIGKGNMLAKYTNEILQHIEFSTQEEDFLRSFKAIANDKLSNNIDAQKLIASIKNNFNRITLIPLADRYPFDDETPLFASLDKYLEKAIPESCYLITQHPLTKSLTDSEAKYLSCKYHNIHIDGYQNVPIGTQFLLPHANSVIGDFSSVSLQALFYDVQIESVVEEMFFDGNYNTFRNPLCSTLTNATQGQRERILHWLLVYSTIPEHKIFNGKWLVDFINDVIANSGADKIWIPYTKKIYSIDEWYTDKWFKRDNDTKLSILDKLIKFIKT